MNDRLKQLMLQAGFAAPELASRANKLVELVVEDLAAELQTMQGNECSRDDYDKGYNSALDSAISIVRSISSKGIE